MAPCDACPLHGRPSMSRPLPELKRGGVLFVGGFPDYGSANNVGKDGRTTPFSGYKTQLLRSMVGKIRDRMPPDRRLLPLYSYACLCNPEFDKDTKRYAINVTDFARCSNILKDYIDLQQPDVIVAMGVDVYKTFGLKGVVAERRCRPASYKTNNGREIPVVCTFDLGTVIKQQGLIELFKSDIESAFKVGVAKDVAQNVSIVATTADEIVAELEKIDDNVTSAEHSEVSRRLVAFDTETTSLHPELPDERIIAMSFSNVDNVGLAFPYQHRGVKFSDEDMARIKAAVEKVLTNPNAVIATANGKFDLQWLWSRGIACNDHNWDIILAEHCLDEDKKGSYSLKDITRLRFPEYGNYEEELTELRQTKWREKDDRAREIVEAAKAGDNENLTNWWVSLSDKERGDKLAEWVRKKYIELAATSGLSVVKTLKRGGVAKPTKGYLASALKVLKRLPDFELPDVAKVSVEVPEELKTKTFEDVPLDMLLHYAAMDAICTRLIAKEQKTAMEGDLKAMRAFKAKTNCEVPPLHRAFLDLSMPLSVEIAHMELHGVRMDRDRAQEYKGKLEEMIELVKDRMYSEIGYRFNPASPGEMAKVLYEDLKLPVIATTDTGVPSTKEATLKDLFERNKDMKILGDVLAWRKLTKTLGSFVKKWIKESERDGYIHASFNQTGTATYRLSSSDPNLQNVPFGLDLPDGTMMNLKSLFLPDEGFDLYDLDIKNAEMRVMCGYSKDEKLISAFNEGKDLHALTAAGISGIPYEQICQFKEDKTRPEYRQRQVAKKVNFGTIYCMQGTTLKTRLWEDCRISVTEQEADEYLEGFFKTYPDVKKYIDNTRAFVDEHNFVYTYFGRRRRFPYGSYMLNGREHIRRQAVNARIQSTSSDMVMSCLVRLNRHLRGLGDGSCVLLTVHDSIPFQAPHGAHEHIKAMLDKIIVQDTAELCPWLPVEWSYDCGWGPNYGDTHGEIR